MNLKKTNVRQGTKLLNINYNIDLNFFLINNIMKKYIFKNSKRHFFLKHE